jgi:hypothetical protein
MNAALGVENTVKLKLIKQEEKKPSFPRRRESSYKLYYLVSGASYVSKLLIKNIAGFPPSRE